MSIPVRPRLLISFFLILLCFPERGHCLSENEIYIWTARQLQADHKTAMPSIQYIDRETLGAKFKLLNKRSYQAWKRIYGNDQAEDLLSLYQRDIVGLFDPKTSMIYIGRFLRPCRRQSILAHEMAHFFQHRQRTLSKTTLKDGEALRIKNEYEARRIERLFYRTFCHPKTCRIVLSK